MSTEAMKRIKSLLQDCAKIDSHTISAVVAECDMAILAKQPDTHEPVAWPLRARVWKRESTQEWVLEIEGTLGDTDMNIRHTQPLSVAYENVPGLHTRYTHRAPSVPDGLQWFTVAEHGLPEVGEVVVGGLWYTDPWLKPECATSFMWGQCRVVDTKHRDFKDGKQWLTFGPSHNQITHWARLNPPATLAAKERS